MDVKQVYNHQNLMRELDPILLILTLRKRILYLKVNTYDYPDDKELKVVLESSYFINVFINLSHEMVKIMDSKVPFKIERTIS